MPPRPDQSERIEETDAKAGSNEGVVRWVLLISLTLAIVALSAIWMTGALTQDPVESQMNVERRKQAQDDQSGANDNPVGGAVAEDPAATTVAPSSAQ